MSSDRNPSRGPRGSLSSSSIGAALIEAAPDAVLVVDEGGAIRLVNDEAERLFGYDRHELIDQAIEIVVPEAARAAHERARASYGAAPSRRRMGNFEVQGRRKHGALVWLAVSLSPVEIEGVRLVIAIARDVSERKAMEDRLRFLSTHDDLTGLCCRGYFSEVLGRLDVGRQFPVSIIVADLDGLKAVNDRDGHAAGDALLVATGEALRAAFRAEDVIARLGGDEFGVLLPGVGAASLDETLARVRAQAAACGIAISVGGATADGPGQLEAILRCADARMYEEKASRVRAPRASVREAG